ncbi:uncharacterized protein [Musca autumnalis]|uniref:uncharacterized protein n=1 Tax=Musca autumnalis TaxID=221902 RepID=UPI003CF872E6
MDSEEKDHNNFLTTVKLNIQNGVYKLRTLDQTFQTVYHNFNCIVDEKNQIINGLVSCRQCNILIKFRGENYKENLQFHINTCVPTRLKKDIETKLSLGLYTTRLEIKRAGRHSLLSRLYARIIADTGQAIEGYVYCTKCSKLMKSVVLKQHSCCDEAELHHIARRESYLRKSVHIGSYTLSKPSQVVQSIWRNFSFIAKKKVIQGEPNIITDYIYCRTCNWVLYYPEENDEELWLQRHQCDMPREELFQRSPHTAWQYLNYKKDLENKIHLGIYKLQRNGITHPEVYKRFGFIVENDTRQRVKDMVCCYKCKKVKKYAEYEDVYYLYQHQCARTSIIAEHKPEERMFRTAGELITSKLIDTIQENITKGVYRVERLNNSKSLMWKVFGIVKDEDDTTLDAYVCCLICKSIFVRSTRCLRHTCLVKYLMNFPERNVLYDKQTSNIELNLICGNYKLKMVENRSSRMWKVFAIIIDAQNKPIKNFLYCRKCARALQVNGGKSGGGCAKDNIAQHHCLLNYNENGSTENGGESGDGAKDIKAQHDCRLNSEENVSRENEVDTNRYKKCYKRWNNSSQNDVRQEDAPQNVAYQDDANTGMDIKEQAVDDFVRKFKQWHEKKKRNQVYNSKNEKNAESTTVEIKETQHRSDGIANGEVKQEHDINMTHEVEQKQGKCKEDSNRFKRCYDRRKSNLQNESNKRLKIKEEIVETESNVRLIDTESKENSNSTPNQEKRLRVKEENIEFEKNFEEEGMPQHVAGKNLVKNPNEINTLEDMEEFTDDNISRLQIKQENMEFVSIVEANEKTNRNLQIEDEIITHKEMRIAIKENNIESDTNLEANARGRSVSLVIKDQFGKETANKNKAAENKYTNSQIKQEDVEKESNVESSSRERNEDLYNHSTLAKDPKSEITQITIESIKDEPLDFIDSNFEYVGRNEQLKIVCCRHCQTLLQYNEENLQYHQCDKIENSTPQSQENNGELFIIKELQEIEGVQVKEEDSEDTIEINDYDIYPNDEESCNNSQTSCYDQEMFSNNEEFDNSVITTNDDYDDNDNAERDDDSTCESPLPKCIQDEYQLFLNEFKTVSYRNNKGIIEHEIHIDIESD